VGVLAGRSRQLPSWRVCGGTAVGTGSFTTHSDWRGDQALILSLFLQVQRTDRPTLRKKMMMVPVNFKLVSSYR